MRVTEAKNLRFRDIETRNKSESTEHLVLWVKGKNKRRDLVPFSALRQTISQFRLIHESNSKKHGWKFDENTFLLTDERGKRINSLGSALANALKKCDLLHAQNGSRRSAGSFRSYYITSALRSGKMTHIQLARNCGSSVAVIEKHYNRMSPSNFPEKFDFKYAATEAYFDHILDNLHKKSDELAEQGVKLVIRKDRPDI